MKNLNKEKVLHMALEDLDKKEEEKISSDINSKIDKLRAWEFSPEEIEKLDEIKKMQIEENKVTMPLRISIVTLVVTMVALIVGTLVEKGLNDPIISIDMIRLIYIFLVLIVLIVYVYCEFDRTDKSSKRNASHMHMRIAILFYREELRKESEEADKE